MSPTTAAPAKAAPAKARPSPAAPAANGQQAKGATSDAANGHPAPRRPQPKSPPPQNGSVTPSATAHEWRVLTIPVERIEPSPYQPRLSFDAGEMAELIASVRAKGVHQPIIVRTAKPDHEALPQEASKNGTNGVTANVITTKRSGAPNPNLVRYELIAGERRLRACKEANRRTIPAIVRDDLSDAECAELALAENVQRSNLSVIEEARGYKRLMLQFRMKEERIAKKVGKSVGTIRDMLKLLQLPEPVQKLLAEKKLTASHGQELLRLAPFERICNLVAERAAKDHLTALSLQTMLLPNVADLKRLKLVAELDYHTKFDWKEECGGCPFKAYVPSGYGTYCLKPEEWQKKQQAAIEQQQQEAARVMEAARQANGQPIEANQLPPGSFRHLSHSEPPAGCTEGCPCRGEISDAHDPTKRFPVCLNPARFNELIQAQRQAQENARQQHYQALWQQAKATLQGDLEIAALNRLATLLALPVLQADFRRYIDRDQWSNLARSVSAAIGVSLPWDDLLDEQREDADLYAVLQAHCHAQPEQLLLLCGCLLLAYEAYQAVRFAGETPPGLSFVLDLRPAHQPELPPDAADEATPAGADFSAGVTPDNPNPDEEETANE